VAIGRLLVAIGSAENPLALPKSYQGLPIATDKARLLRVRFLLSGSATKLTILLSTRILARRKKKQRERRRGMPEESLL
jgi:hypothetical protein